MKTNERGLTLLEVMISIIILALGILGLAPMIVLSTEGNNIARDYTVASNLAKESLEYFQGLDSMVTVPYTNIEASLQGKYTRTVYVQDATIDTLIPANMYQIDVIVAWRDVSGREQSTKYATLLRKES